MRRQLQRDVAAGLVYLHSRDILHGDLAARNILLRRHDDRVTACVSDFGLANQLQQGINTMAVERSVPVRWSAPEVVLAHATHGQVSVYKRPSDVWSYGVILYELHSYGALPYADIAPPNATRSNEVIIDHVVHKRGILPQPHDCPAPDYAIMVRCWTYAPEQRPTMAEVLDQLDALHRSR